MTRTTSRLLRTVVAGIVILSFFATWLATIWAGRETDSVLLIGAVAILLGAGYYLWDDAMGQGVDAAQDLQGGGDGADEE